jgi:hypothetical protein
MGDTQALLSELARVKALFQLRTINLILSGGHTRPEPGVVQPSICDDPRACLPTDRDILFHALHDGECSDWFVRAHDPDQQLARDIADADCGREVSDLFHNAASAN